MPGSLIKFVPNVLSGLRLALAAAFPLLPAAWRLPAIIVGGLSDWIDGVVARRYHAMTSAGAMLDAIADKVFTLSVLVTIVAAGDARWWQALCVMARDLVVAAIALYAIVIRRHDAFGHMRPRMPGKITTSLVFLWLAALLAGASSVVQWTLFALAAAASSAAAMDYLAQFVRRFAEVRDATDSRS
jgi:phosphatidylglycerophosphate synthase